LSFFFWRILLSSARTIEAIPIEVRDIPIRTLGQAFEMQAALTPLAVAVISAGRQMTYRELDERSNRLARHLQSLGVGPDVLTAIAVERSLEMVVGLLAILKAGGAYVPIDPTFPAQRVALMLEDSQASVILASQKTRSCLPQRASQIIVLIDGFEDTGDSSARVSSAAGETNLAYVIYTSGSTGKPKGVMIEHRNVLNLFAGMDDALGPNPGIWLAVTSISFDISVVELFWTLSRGFTVVVHGDDGIETIPQEIRKYRVSHVQCTPSLARMVALSPDGLSSLGTLKKLALGGEALSLFLACELKNRFSGELYNMYGPTESTVWSTTSRIQQSPNRISIGKPITRTQVYVLDEELHPVAPGESGSLFIGGDGVARGYWRRPELTAERFLPDPFLPGNRIYRTGDMARFLPDGDLEFLGRSDFQVKLRGFRIELGEIEASLEGQPGVAQAVVRAHDFRPEGESEDKRLVAYVVPKRGDTVTADGLRSALSKALPDYMVPSTFLVLEALPLTANGKVDRNALPKPQIDHIHPQPEQPQNELERTIADAWKEALGVDHIGLDCNFFDLGAHSMMLAEVHLELEQSLGRPISLVDFFQFPTVHALAAHLRGETRAAVVSNRAEKRLAARLRRKERG
jgi:amino acid adenylation domain-containing protein